MTHYGPLTAWALSLVEIALRYPVEIACVLALATVPFAWWHRC